MHFQQLGYLLTGIFFCEKLASFQTLVAYPTITLCQSCGWRQILLPVILYLSWSAKNAVLSFSQISFKRWSWSPVKHRVRIYEVTNTCPWHSLWDFSSLNSPLLAKKKYAMEESERQHFSSDTSWNTGSYYIYTYIYLYIYIYIYLRLGFIKNQTITLSGKGMKETKETRAYFFLVLWSIPFLCVHPT